MMRLTISEDGKELLLHIPLSDVQKVAWALLGRAQKNVLELFAAGNCHKEIAAKLGISVSTSKYHMREVHRKFREARVH